MSNPSEHLHHIRLAREIQERYHGYLKTSFYFRDPHLRRSFVNELDEGQLIKGPFLESSPVYRRETTTRDLLTQLLIADVDSGFVASLDPNRMLYVHQERAMRRLTEGRNVIVATGTGSGKTEAYLLPILLALYQEGLAGQRGPGVRALVLYPMNALANDQRRRLGELAARLQKEKSRFSFTFGRYTGETPEDERDSRRNARQQLDGRLPGELVLRSEMRRSPPDILLTNFSMLEYLLLRPDDSQLFDDGSGATWRFCVLDEAHQYRGTKGIEMAMLLRRLKQRLTDGGLGRRLQCIATSASLGGGEEGREGLAMFARELFDEAFSEDDVILEELARVPPGQSARIRPDEYLDLGTRIEADPSTARTALQELASRHDIFLSDTSSIPECLYRLLSNDPRLQRLRETLEAPRDLHMVADTVFEELPPEEREAALQQFLRLVTSAQEPNSGTPLLSLRYHFFLRALEGAFVRCWPTRRVLLSRGSNGGESSEDDRQGTWFEVALCRECGQHYFVGRRDGSYVREALRDWSNDEFSVSFFRPLEGDEVSRNDETPRSRLCLRCGAITRQSRTPTNPSCGHDSLIDVVEESVRDLAEDQMRTCGACGYRGPDPVREIVHGNDGPNAVIATAMHRSLPSDRRKVLGFVDGRQEAAFFAWYLQKSYGSLLGRNLLLVCLRSLAADGYEEVSLATLAARLRDTLRNQQVIPASADDLEALKEAWKLVFREFITDEPRLSLEGVGLVRWLPKLPEDLRIPGSLSQSPWSLSDSESRELVSLLLDSVRTDHAVELRADPGVNLSWSDLEMSASQYALEIGGGPYNVNAWDGPRTRRVRFLVRVLMTSVGAPSDERERVLAAQQLLREVWEAFKEAGGESRLLLRVRDAQRANPVWWRLRLLTPRDSLYRCDTCGRYQTVSARGVCARYGCPGTLTETSVDDSASNHYRVVYQQQLPPSLRAEEHTAQIEREQARLFQEDFEKGRIHFLSCSTTFELGVDLGDLDTIFLRNVPPEPFNYAQRVGRAGRRPGHPGFAVTYCRRRPHDLAHFQDPGELLAGRTAPPLLRVTNDKIALRHMIAVVLSEFFRAPGNRERFKTVGTFLVEMTRPRAVSDILRFLEDHRTDLEPRLRAIVPESLRTQLGLHDGSWTQAITNSASRLAIAESEVSDDYQKVERFEEEARNERRYQDADWARRRAETIVGEDVISFLSRKAVIPKYGFPVDVVELDLQRSRKNHGQETSNVSLQRDLSIAVAEFAPGSKLVANKKLWASYGLKRVAEREWGWRQYLKCPRHGTFVSWKPEDQPPQAQCCDAARCNTYVDPVFGFITDRKPPEDPSYRPARVYTTRPYFLESQGESERIDMAGVAEIRKAAPGKLVVLCEGRKGQGFLICPICGAGVQNERDHKTPLGGRCTGQPLRVALGHEFVTDVLRLRFHHTPTSTGADGGMLWFGYSLAYALLHGAHEILEVPLQDLSVTVRSTAGDELPEIILFDDVPGGAGLVARLEDPFMFRRCLQKARDRTNGSCGCAPDTSCYGCLRSYSNQFAHPRIRRGPVLTYLDNALAHWKE